MQVARCRTLSKWIFKCSFVIFFSLSFFQLRYVNVSVNVAYNIIYKFNKKKLKKTKKQIRLQQHYQTF